MSEPREWKIKAGWGGDPNYVSGPELKDAPALIDCEEVRVIEKSAYDALKAELKQATKGRTIDANEYQVTDAHIENLRLKAKCVAYERALKKISQLSAEVDRCGTARQVLYKFKETK